MSKRLSSQTRALLELAGWPGNSTVPMAEYEQTLRGAGYPVLPVVASFLEQFGGLRVCCPHPNVPAECEEFHFDAGEAAAVASRGWIQEYSERVGSPLTVIGEAANGYMILMMDPTGIVYAGYDDVLRLVGTSGEDAIEALCTGREMLEVAARPLAAVSEPV